MNTPELFMNFLIISFNSTKSKRSSDNCTQMYCLNGTPQQAIIHEQYQKLFCSHNRQSTRKTTQTRYSYLPSKRVKHFNSSQGIPGLTLSQNNIENTSLAILFKIRILFVSIFLKTYVLSNDKLFAAASIHAIGRCASTIKEVSENCLSGLVNLMSKKDGKY